MKNLIKLLPLIVIAPFVTGCASLTMPSPQYSVQAETDGQIGSLKGESKARFILYGLLAQWGDASVVKAVENSGGQYIRTVDHKFTSFLGLYGTYTTKVTTDKEL